MSNYYNYKYYMYGEPFIDDLFAKYIKNLDDVNISSTKFFPKLDKEKEKECKLWAYTLSCGYFKSFEEIINHKSFKDSEKSFVVSFYISQGLLTYYPEYNPIEFIVVLFKSLQDNLSGKHFLKDYLSEEYLSRNLLTLAKKSNDEVEVIKYACGKIVFDSEQQANSFLMPIYDISSKKDEIQSIEVKIYGIILNKTILFSDLLKKYD